MAEINGAFFEMLAHSATCTNAVRSGMRQHFETRKLWVVNSPAAYEDANTAGPIGDR